MYVCMYACMHACMHACMYVCMHACTEINLGGLIKCRYIGIIGRKSETAIQGLRFRIDLGALFKLDVYGVIGNI